MKPIPLLSDLYTNIAADLVSKLGLTTPDQLKSVNTAFASVEASQFWLAYTYLVDIQRQLSPFTADPASEGGQLNNWGQLRLGRQPFPATDGYYTATVIGVAGSVIRASITFKSNDDSTSPGNLYILDNEYICTGTNDVITLRALDAGVDYLLAVADGLTPTEPITGVSDTVAIASVTTAPTEAETTELYRQNIINTYRLMPQGGARGDYRIWAGDAPGIQRVFIYVQQENGGTVQIFVEATPIDSTDGNGTASSALLTAAEAVFTMDPDTTIPIDYRTRKPAQAFLNVLSVTPIPVDILITGLQTNTTAIQATISADLIAFLFNVRPFLDGVDLQSDRNDTVTAPKLQSVVTDAIGNANTFLGFSLSVNGVVVNTYQFGLGNIPYLRNLNYA